MSDKKHIFKSFMSICDFNDSNIGSEIIYKHIRFLDKDKNTNLKITDKVNGQDIINSFADSCDINNIVRTMSVDTYQKLVSDMKNAVSFIDMTKIPNNIFDLQNFKYEMQSKFDSLPVDLKNIYDNNYYKFIDSIENGSVNQIVDSYFKSLKNNSIVNNINNGKGDVTDEK